MAWNSDRFLSNYFSIRYLQLLFEMKTYQIKKIPSKMIYDEDTGRHIEIPASFVIEDSTGKTILDIRNVAALERFINDLAKND